MKNDLISTFSKLMFLLLPIFALLLKVMYLFSGRYYMEHLLQVIHTHCFIYMSLLLMSLAGLFTDLYITHITFAADSASSILSLLEILLVFYIVYYTYKVVRIVYQESRLLSLIKYSISVLAYMALLIYHYSDYADYAIMVKPGQ